MKYAASLVVFGLMCGPTSLLARDLAPVLNDQDQQTLVQALDALWKQQGLNALDNGVAAAIQTLYQKLKAAAQAQAPDIQPSKEAPSK